ATIPHAERSGFVELTIGGLGEWKWEWVRQAKGGCVCVRASVSVCAGGCKDPSGRRHQVLDDQDFAGGAEPQTDAAVCCAGNKKERFPDAGDATNALKMKKFTVDISDGNCALSDDIELRIVGETEFGGALVGVMHISENSGVAHELVRTPVLRFMRAGAVVS
ncbi:MAG: hypothetical protein BJ554DRAFT_1682, partial [Olpidium bornovanus]